MQLIIKILSIIAIICLILLGIGIIPMGSIPEKMIKSSNIKPISISSYGYMDLLRMEYVVKDFSYIAKVEEGSYLFLKAKKIGSGIFSSGNISISMSDCNVYLLTTKAVSEIIPIAKGYMEKDHGQFNINGSNCKINIKKISGEDIKLIEADSIISEDEITQTLPDIGFYGEGLDFSFIKDDFITTYLIDGEVNKNKFGINFTKDSISQVLKFSIGDSKINHEKIFATTIEQIDGSVADIGYFIQNFFCTSKKCKNAANEIDGSINFSLKNENGWSGKTSGIVNSNVKLEDGIIKIQADKLQIKTVPRKQEDVVLVENAISIYSLFEKIVEINTGFDLKLNGFGYNDIALSAINAKYDAKNKTFDFDSKYRENGRIWTTGNNLENLTFSSSNIAFSDFLTSIGFDKKLTLENSNSLVGDCNFIIKKDDFSIYFSEILYKIKKQNEPNKLIDDDGKAMVMVGSSAPSISQAEEGSKQSILNHLGASVTLDKPVTAAKDVVVKLPEVKHELPQDIFQNTDFNIKILSNNCIFDCKREVAFKNINLFDYLKKDALIEYFEIPKYVSRQSGIQQTALIYIQKVDQISKDFENFTKIKLENISLGDLKITKGEIGVLKSASKREFSMKDFDSNLIKGDFEAKINLSPNSRSTFNISGNLDKFKTKELIEILYTDANPYDVTILQPSLVGFNGTINLEIDDISEDFSNISLLGSMDNGNVIFSNAKIKYRGNDIALNASLSLVSKPTMSLGIAFPKISIASFLPEGTNLPISGVASISGSFGASGFTFNEIKDSLKGSFSGKLYNLLIKDFSLQFLSNKLMDTARIKDLNIEHAMRNGNLLFKESDLVIAIENRNMLTSISNAKTVGVSMSGTCGFNMNSLQIGRCSGIFNILGRDLENMQNFYNLQMSFAASSSILKPIFTLNYDQILQYKQQAIKKLGQ